MLVTSQVNVIRICCIHITICVAQLNLVLCCVVRLRLALAFSPSLVSCEWIGLHLLYYSYECLCATASLQKEVGHITPSHSVTKELRYH